MLTYKYDTQLLIEGENLSEDDTVVLLPSESGTEAETVVTVESSETTSSGKKYKL